MMAKRLVFDVLREESQAREGEWYQMSGRSAVERQGHGTHPLKAPLVLAEPRIEEGGPAGTPFSMREYLEFRQQRDASGHYTTAEGRLVLTIERLLTVMRGDERPEGWA